MLNINFKQENNHVRTYTVHTSAQQLALLPAMVPITIVVTAICNNCGEPYRIYPSANAERKTCSYACLGMVKRARAVARTAKLSQPRDYKLIALPHGRTTKVSIEDFEDLARLPWSLDTHGYAKLSGKTLLMHHAVIERWLGSRRGLHTDHINHDRLDNRRSNLRLVTQAENNRNRRKGVNARAS